MLNPCIGEVSQEHRLTCLCAQVKDLMKEEAWRGGERELQRIWHQGFCCVANILLLSRRRPR